MKIKRLSAVCLAVVMLMSAITIPASAYSYDFSFPNTINGSMRSSDMETRGKGTASFTPAVVTVPTIYFLSPSQGTDVNATKLITKSDKSTSYFTFYDGYGGEGQQYCLSGCPDMSMGSWNAYSVTGSWTM